MDINNINTTGADLREEIATITFTTLVELCNGDSIEAIIIANKYFRSNERIIASKDVDEIILLAELVGAENNDELVMFLINKNIFQHMDRPLIPDIRIDLNAISQGDCINMFRFDQKEIQTIVANMPFPFVIHTEKRDKFTLIEGFCIYTCRMKYPCRWCDLEKVFGRSYAGLSRILATFKICFWKE